MNRMGGTRCSRLCVLLLACMVLASLFMLPSSIRPVHAAGTLLVAPSQQGPFQAGSTFTYQVNVSNMDPFDSWDVAIVTDPSMITPLSISVSSNIFGSVTPVENCINGVGSGCTGKDGAGWAHSAAACFCTPVGGSGLLFTIVYKAVVS